MVLKNPLNIFVISGDCKSEEKESDDNPRSTVNWFLYVSALIVNMSSFSAGTAYAWSSPAIPKLQDPLESPLPHELTLAEESWIAAFLPLGAILGAFLSGLLSPIIGKKRVIIIMIVPIILSNIVLALSCDVKVFYFGRFLSGMSVGSSTTLIPIYLCEIAEVHNRGMLGCMFSTFLSLGNLYSYVIGPFLDVKNFTISCLWSSFVLFVVFPFIPDSIQYYISQKETRKALAVLEKFRIDDNKKIKEEFDQIINIMEENKSCACDILKQKSFRKGLWICLTLIAFQQFSGIGVIVFYMQSIFDDAASTISSYVSTVAVASVQCIFCILAVIVVDRLGRKVLLLVSAVGTAISLAILGSYFYLKNENYNIENLSWLPITSILLHMAAYNIGFGPVPFAILGEIFPPTPIAPPLIAMTCLSLTFTSTKFFPSLVDMIGYHYAFWMLGCFMIAATLFILIFVPETKGKSLKEIIVILEK